MPWLKLLHIVAVIVWCGALLYLPALIATAARPGRAGAAGMAALDAHSDLLRTLFTAVATPAALLAITSGTWLFATRGPLAPWLMAKLALVGLLVLGHAGCGLLVLRSERGEHAGLRVASRLLGITTLLWLAGIAWLVLRKPLWP